MTIIHHIGLHCHYHSKYINTVSYFLHEEGERADLIPGSIVAILFTIYHPSPISKPRHYNMQIYLVFFYRNNIYCGGLL
jgi:hypothetical protein